MITEKIFLYLCFFQLFQLFSSLNENASVFSLHCKSLKMFWNEFEYTLFETCFPLTIHSTANWMTWQVFHTVSEHK